MQFYSLLTSKTSCCKHTAIQPPTIWLSFVRTGLRWRCEIFLLDVLRAVLLFCRLTLWSASTILPSLCEALQWRLSCFSSQSCSISWQRHLPSADVCVCMCVCVSLSLWMCIFQSLSNTHTARQSAVIVPELFLLLYESFPSRNRSIIDIVHMSQHCYL